MVRNFTCLIVTPFKCQNRNILLDKFYLYNTSVQLKEKYEK